MSEKGQRKHIVLTASGSLSLSERSHRRDAPAAAQGHGEGRVGEGQGDGQEPGFGRRRPTEAPAVRLKGTVTWTQWLVDRLDWTESLTGARQFLFFSLRVGFCLFSFSHFQLSVLVESQVLNFCPEHFTFWGVKVHIGTPETLFVLRGVQMHIHTFCQMLFTHSFSIHIYLGSTF